MPIQKGAPVLIGPQPIAGCGWYSSDRHTIYVSEVEVCIYLNHDDQVRFGEILPSDEHALWHVLDHDTDPTLRIAKELYYTKDGGACVFEAARDIMEGEWLTYTFVANRITPPYEEISVYPYEHF
jgi:hypothetical protein